MGHGVTTLQCKSCGLINPENASICRKCSNPLMTPQQQNNNISRGPSKTTKTTMNHLKKKSTLSSSDPAPINRTVPNINSCKITDMIYIR